MSLEQVYEVGKIVQECKFEEAKRLDTYRHRLEPYIFNYLIKTNSAMLEDFWKSYIPVKKAPCAFIIVERRDHPNFHFLLRNIAWANPNMSVYIFCSDINYNFILSLLGEKAEHYTIVQWFKGDASRENAIKEYNATFKNYKFYEQIDAEYGITVQMDVIFRKKISESLFTGHYWGAPWAWNTNCPGGGGATIRNISSLLQLCKFYNPEPEQYSNVDPEDGWFSEKIKEQQMFYPALDFRKNSIMESIPVQDPSIMHQFWTFFDQYLSQPKKDVVQYFTHLLTLQ